MIELLIVVAIIAILAAIAVPNFLEAQVRSKVSRVHADMRSIATAIEAYTVDYNRPPESGRERAYTHNPRDWSLSNWWYQITTPVAYMSDVPYDPFRENAYTLGRDDGWQVKKPFTPYDYECMFAWKKTVDGEYGDPGPGWGKLMNAGMTWALQSAGPSKQFNISIYNILNMAVGLRNPNPSDLVGGTYDPTNGTMSVGLIVRTNQGILASPRD